MTDHFSPEELAHYARLVKLFPGDKEIKSPTDANVTCPRHADNHPSLGIDLRKNGSGPKAVFNCRSQGCSQEAIIATAGLRPEDWNFFPNAHGHRPIEGCTLRAYANAKKLPLEFLEGEEVALEQIDYWGKPAVAIPYTDVEGNIISTRFRINLHKPKTGPDDRFRWKKRDKPRSRKALEAAEYARGEGRFDEMHEALFRAFFKDGKDIGSEEVLLEVGASVGLDREGLRVALEEGRYTEKVLADEELARRLGVGSVPTMFVGLTGQPLEKVEAIVGAQPYGGRIEAAIERALSRR
jgi:hypothetical protein